MLQRRTRSELYEHVAYLFTVSRVYKLLTVFMHLCVSPVQLKEVLVYNGDFTFKKTSVPWELEIMTIEKRKYSHGISSLNEYLESML